MPLDAQQALPAPPDCEKNSKMSSMPSSRWVDRFAGSMQYRRGSSGFSDAAFAGGMTPPVDTIGAFSPPVNNNNSNSNCSPPPRTLLVLPRKSVDGLKEMVTASPADNTFLDIGFPSQQQQQQQQQQDDGKGKVMTLHKFLLSHRAEREQQQQQQQEGASAAPPELDIGYANKNDNEEDYNAFQDGQVSIVDKAMRDIQLQDAPNSADKQQQDDMFSLDLESEEGASASKLVEPAKKGQPAWQDQGSKPVGKLTAYLLNSGLAQNWFFKKDDAKEDEEDCLEGANKSLHANDDAVANKSEAVHSAKQQQLREINMWSPQAL